MKRVQDQPPRLAKWIFRLYSGRVAGEDLEGDMDELFYSNLRTMSSSQARWKYWRRVISLFGSYVIRRRRMNASHHPHSNNSINLNMIKSYLLMAWRVMARNRVYTLINVFGLTLGISGCIIVFLVVSHAFSFDRFHADEERIYRLKTHDLVNKDWVCACVPGPVYPVLRDDYAGAEAITGYHTLDAKTSVTVNGEVKRFDRNTGSIIVTNQEYFQIFQYQWLAGNPAAFSKPMQVVLTENRAKTYFGNIEPQDVLGKSVAYNDSLQLTVAGVVKDWSENSDFARTEFISYSTIENTFLRNVIQNDNWGVMMHSSQSFIKIRPGGNIESVAAEIKNIINAKSTQKYAFTLEPLANIHFLQGDESESTIMSTLYGLGALAAFILVIAAINFINLSTAQSITRSREIGIRKVMGSRKHQIVIQFMCETFVLSLLSLILGIALIRPLLMAFTTYLPQGISFNPLAMDNWVFFLCLLFIVSILAGIYPALVMSSFLPASNLSSRGVTTGRNKFSLRKTLVVFQFAVSLFFITATLVISGQLEYMRTKDRGFSTAGIMTFRTNWAGPIDKVQTLVDRIRAFAGTEQVTMQGFQPMGFAMWTNSFDYVSDKETIKGNTSVKAGDEQYIPLYQIRLIAGRNFLPSDSVREAVVNEAFIKSIGINDPLKAIGEHIRIDVVSKPVTICGVVKDFHQQSFRNAIGPCMIMNFRPAEHSVSVRFSNPDVLANMDAISKIESEFKAIYPDETFSYHFIEEEIGWMHGGEEKFSSLARIAMGITIFISCMGVFGLSMFTATRKTREIGIRKVLGASSRQIVSMLNREFVVLIVLSVVIATPVAWYAMNNWLLLFMYRIDLAWWYFLVAGAIALVTALITVSFQSLKAANGDPVRALKTE